MSASKSASRPTSKPKPPPVAKTTVSDEEDRRDAAVGRAALARFEASGDAPISLAEVKKRLGIE
jgi:hypothetical protein